MGANFGWSRSIILFQDSDGNSAGDATIRQRAVTASLARRYGHYGYQFSAGGLIDGTLEHEGLTYDVNPGWLVSAQISRQWFGGDNPFLTGGLSLGASGTQTKLNGVETSLFAADLRLSIMVGDTFFDFWTPYAAVRGFIGPVVWQAAGEDLLGGDQSKFALGLGSLFRLSDFSVSVYGAPVGERSFGAGINYSF
ncbi:MAG: hypothetical protein HRU17_24065 [Polyangiaceae bacterium]|nr:hypothetical protein [Polyangiaceae bacterium]